LPDHALLPPPPPPPEQPQLGERHDGGRCKGSSAQQESPYFGRLLPLATPAAHAWQKVAESVLPLASPVNNEDPDGAKPPEYVTCDTVSRSTVPSG
jgi:hypothetical protein